MRLSLRSVLLFALLMSAASSSFSQGQMAPPSEKTAVVYGQNIRYFEAGQGPAVILLHGLGSVKEVWLPTFGLLSAKYHVYAIDQLGFGHSDKPLIEYKISTWVDFLQAFMQSQNIAKATLIGNSLGGWIATEFAVQHPEMVEKLVLVDSAGLASQGSITVNLNPATVAETRALLEAVFYDKKMVTDQFVLQVFTNHMRNNDGYTIQRTMAGVAQQPQFEDDKLNSIHAPTLVVSGREDELVSVSRAEKLHKGITGSKFVVFDHCGHVPQIEKPDEFNRAVLDFLAGH